MLQRCFRPYTASRLDVAKACDVKNPKNDKEGQKLHAIVLSKLEIAGFADDAWNEEDIYKSSYAQKWCTKGT